MSAIYTATATSTGEGRAGGRVTSDDGVLDLTLAVPAPMGGPGGGQSSQPESYDAVTTVSEDTDLSDTTLTSTGADENALLVTDGTATVTNTTIDRTSADSTLHYVWRTKFQLSRHISSSVFSAVQPKSLCAFSTLA